MILLTPAFLFSQLHFTGAVQFVRAFVSHYRQPTVRIIRRWVLVELSSPLNPVGSVTGQTLLLELREKCLKHFEGVSRIDPRQNLVIIHVYLDSRGALRGCVQR